MDGVFKVKSKAFLHREGVYSNDDARAYARPGCPNRVYLRHSRANQSDDQKNENTSAKQSCWP